MENGHLCLVGGDWNMIGLFSHILGISSSQLTFIFFRGLGTTKQNFFWGKMWGFFVFFLNLSLKIEGMFHDFSRRVEWVRMGE